MLYETGTWLRALMNGSIPDTFFSRWYKEESRRWSKWMLQMAEGLSRWLEQMVDLYDLGSAVLESLIDDDRD